MLDIQDSRWTHTLNKKSVNDETVNRRLIINHLRVYATNIDIVLINTNELRIIQYSYMSYYLMVMGVFGYPPHLLIPPSWLSLVIEVINYTRDVQPRISCNFIDPHHASTGCQERCSSQRCGFNTGAGDLILHDRYTVYTPVWIYVIYP